MDSIKNNNLTSNASPQQILNNNFISSELISQFVNFAANSQAKQRRHSVVYQRCSPHTSGDACDNMNSLNMCHLPSNAETQQQLRDNRFQQAEEFYSALTNRNVMDQREKTIAKQLADSAITDHPTRHLSEPGSVAVRRGSPVDENVPLEHSDVRPRSCRTSPSLASPNACNKQQQQSQSQQQNSLHSLQQLSSSGSGSSGSSASSAFLFSTPHSAASSPQNTIWGGGDLNSGMFTQSDLREFVRKTSSALPSLNPQDIRKANGTGQLYLLVPSDYPVIMTCPLNGNGIGSCNVEKLEDRNGLLAESLAAVASSSPTAVSIGTTATSTIPLDKLRSSSIVVSPQGDPSPTSNNIRFSTPRKNSTCIPPHLKSIKEDIQFSPQLTVEIARSISQNTRNADDELTSLPHLSSLGYRFSVDIPSSIDSASPPLNNINQKTSPTNSTNKKNSIPVEFNGTSLMEVLAKQHHSAATVALLKSTTVGASDIPLTDGMAVDSNGSSLFFPSNESSPNRNYMGRMSGDTKDIRRRVSHNEVERRRRDRINTWIAELYKLLPPEQQAKSQYQSKGVVLKRVCEYFQNQDASMTSIRDENRALKQEVFSLNRENQLLRAAVHFQSQQQQQSEQQYTVNKTKVYQKNTEQSMEDSVTLHHRSPKRPLLVSLQETIDDLNSPSSPPALHSSTKRANRSSL